MNAHERMILHDLREKAVKDPSVRIFAVKVGKSRTETVLYWRFFVVEQGGIMDVTKQVARFTQTDYIGEKEGLAGHCSWEITKIFGGGRVCVL